jgi:hypothetical protein
MKHFFPLPLLLLFFHTFSANAQNAPVTSVGYIYNATTGAGATVVPVTVKNFTDIGSLQLKLTYRSTKLTLVETNLNPVFTGMNVNTYTAGGIGYIIITWTGTEGITLPDNAHLADITFTFISGISELTWTTSQCFYRKFTGNILLTDTPKSNYYINGGVTNLPAPVTSLPAVSIVVPGPVTIPVTVKNFTNIGSLTLLLQFDTTVLTFVSATLHPLFAAMLVGRSPGEPFILFNWYGTGRTLADNDTLVKLNFIYSNAPGIPAFSPLNWYDFGPSCMYGNASAIELFDLPQETFYKDGIVAAQVSPVTWIPPDTNATPGSTVGLLVLVNDFTNISGFSLVYKIDPAVLSLIDYNVNPIITAQGTMNVTTGSPGTDGKVPVALTWSPAGPVSLSDGDTLIRLNYFYLSGSSALDWDVTLCSYLDVNLNPLNNAPAETYYTDGLVSSRVAPVTYAGSASTTLGQIVTIPIRVNGFRHIGEFKFTLNINPGVLDCQSASLVAPIGGTLTFTPIQTGQFQVSWTGPVVDALPDSTILLNLNCSFSYFGGTSVIQFSPVATACEYREGPALPALWDQPKSSFYIDGSVTAPPQLAANVKVLLEGPYHAGLMTTALNSNGLLPLSQPYSGAPWNYPGTETVSALPANVTDWVLVELRTSTAASSKVASAAGFVRKDGLITNLDGTSCLSFGSLTAGNYYVVVYHRNHMPVMTAASTLLKMNSVVYDFTTGSSKVYGGANGCKLIDSGASKWGMITGDGNGDGNIYVEDYTDYWIPEFGLSNVYSIGDYSMDGVVFSDDYTDFWIPNFGKNNVLP